MKVVKRFQILHLIIKIKNSWRSNSYNQTQHCPKIWTPFPATIPSSDATTLLETWSTRTHSNKSPPHCSILGALNCWTPSKEKLLHGYYVGFVWTAVPDANYRHIGFGCMYLYGAEVLAGAENPWRKQQDNLRSLPEHEIRSRDVPCHEKRLPYVQHLA